jgi:phosphoglycolate phosphatase
MIDAILFDLDGTLVDSRADLCASVNFTRIHAGLAPLPDEAIGPMIGDGVVTLLERALGKRDDLPELVAVFRAHYLDHCLDRTVAYPGVASTLAALAVLLPGRLAVLTNKPVAPARKILEAVGLAGFFAATIGGDSGFGRKPDPAVFAAARRAVGDPPAARVLIVGDGLTDLDGGRAAGLRTCGVTYGIGAPERVRAAHPDGVIDAFADLIPLLDALARDQGQGACGSRRAGATRT